MRKSTLALLVAALVAIVGISASGMLVQGCDGDDCLVYGENCSQSYQLDTYGKTLPCCDGTSCSPGIISGMLVCH